jgi:amidase/aspartyl-tRNA(Asn)/glutamyl-tRNA(Gln) amidotransferase subunit A
MARHVRDAALALKVMAGPDGRDPVCRQDDPPDYVAAVAAGVEGLRIAWTDDFGFARDAVVEETPRVLDVVRRAAMDLASRGAVVAPTDEQWEDPDLSLAANAVAARPISGEVRTFFERRLANARRIDGESAVPPLPDVAAAPSAVPSPEAYRVASEARARNWKRFRRLFYDNDILLSATSPMVTRPVGDWGVMGFPHILRTYLAYTRIFNTVHLTAVSVPCGFVDGLPVGIQIVCWPGREDLVFRVAGAIQEAFPIPQPPLT